MTEPPDARPRRELRREIHGLHGEVVAYGKRAGLERVVKLELGEVLRHYLDADIEDGDLARLRALKRARHKLLRLRRQLIEAANDKCRKTLDEMSAKYDTAVVHNQLNTPERRKTVSEVAGFLSGTAEVLDDEDKLRDAMSEAGETGDKAAGNLDMLLEAYPTIIKAGSKKSILRHPLVTAIAGALAGASLLGLIGWLVRH